MRLDAEQAAAKLAAMRAYREFAVLDRGPVGQLSNPAIHGYEVFWPVPRRAGLTVRLLVISDLYPPIAFGGYERSCADLVDGLRDATRSRSSPRTSAGPPLRRSPGSRRELPYWARSGARRAGAGGSAARAARSRRRVWAQLRPDLVYVSNCLTVPQAAPRTVAEAGVPVVYRLSELWFASALYRERSLRGSPAGGRRGPRRAWSWLVARRQPPPSAAARPARPAPAAVSWCSDELRARVPLRAGDKPVLERTIHRASRGVRGARAAAGPRRRSPTSGG